MIAFAFICFAIAAAILLMLARAALRRRVRREDDLYETAKWGGMT